MTALSITAANVKWVGGVRPVMVKGGATLTRGQCLYLDTTDLEHKVADADVDASSVFAGVALTDGTDGSDMLIAPPGAVVNIGATTTAGTIYCIGLAGGDIVPWADLGTGDYVTVLFVGTGTANVEIIGKRQYSGTHA